MSVDAAVSDGSEAPFDQNAQAAEEAKRMMAELEREKSSTSNDVKDESLEEVEKKAEHDEAEDEKREQRQDRRRDYDRHDRDGGRGRGRGGRGRGRGGFDRNGHGNRYQDNVKTDYSTEAITDDPVQIRKQVNIADVAVPLTHAYSLFSGSLLLLRLKSTERQVPLQAHRRRREQAC
jgi:hypothetical protein